MHEIELKDPFSSEKCPSHGLELLMHRVYSCSFVGRGSAELQVRRATRRQRERWKGLAQVSSSDWSSYCRKQKAGKGGRGCPMTSSHTVEINLTSVELWTERGEVGWLKKKDKGLGSELSLTRLKQRHAGDQGAGWVELGHKAAAERRGVETWKWTNWRRWNDFNRNKNNKQTWRL